MKTLFVYRDKETGVSGPHDQEMDLNLEQITALANSTTILYGLQNGNIITPVTVKIIDKQLSLYKEPMWVIFVEKSDEGHSYSWIE